MSLFFSQYIGERHELQTQVGAGSVDSRPGAVRFDLDATSTLAPVAYFTPELLPGEEELRIYKASGSKDVWAFYG